jgi:hypothetical protein
MKLRRVQWLVNELGSHELVVNWERPVLVLGSPGTFRSQST